MSLNALVFIPSRVPFVLPCIGSQIQSTGLPVADTARRIGGNSSPILSAPQRWMSESRPSSPSGFRTSTRWAMSAAFIPVPTFMPRGLRMPRAYSM